MHRVLAVLWLGVVCLAAQADELAPFSTDGCSDFPNGTTNQKNLWLGCCIAHDKTYWAGGTYADRLQADQDLERCVAAVGEPAVARLMLAGVRVGGAPYWPTSFRWGYGWPWPRGYKTLTDGERAEVQKRLAEYDSGIVAAAIPKQ